MNHTTKPKCMVKNIRNLEELRARTGRPASYVELGVRRRSGLNCHVVCALDEVHLTSRSSMRTVRIDAPGQIVSTQCPTRLCRDPTVRSSR